MDVPFRPHPVSSSPPATLASPSYTNQETQSSAESITTVSSFWNDSPISARSPAISPNTPPSDEEKLWGEPRQAEASPSDRVARRRRTNPLTRPPLGNSSRKPFAQAHPNETLYPPKCINNNNNDHSPRSLESDEIEIENILSTDELGSILADSAQSTSIAPGKNPSHTKSQPQNKSTSIPTKQRTAVLGGNPASPKSGTTRTVKAESLVTEQHHGHSQRRNLLMPCTWISEDESSGVSSDSSTESLEDLSEDSDLQSSRSDKQASKQPTTPTNSPQNEKRRTPRKTIVPLHPEFVPYHKISVDVNEELFRIFGGVDVQKADRARKGSKKGTEEIGEKYPWIFSRQKNSCVGYGHGHIYMFESPQFPGFIKIGMTTQPVSKRIRQWTIKCRLAFEVIKQAGDKPFHNVDIIEKIIHTELWAHRRSFKCRNHRDPDKLPSHRLPLKVEQDTKRGQTKKQKYYTSNGEWFEISREEAFAVVDSWREWASPDFSIWKLPAVNSLSGTSWQRGCRVVSELVLGSLTFLRFIFVLSPYGNDRQLRGYWVRRYHALTSAIKHGDSDIWKQWRRHPSFLEIFIEFFLFSKDNVQLNYSTSSQLGYSFRGAVYWAEAVIRSIIAPVLLLIPCCVAWICCGGGGNSLSRAASGVGSVFIYFVMKWLFIRS